MSIAKIYAKALFAAAAEGQSSSDASNICNELDADLAVMNQTIESSKELKIVLQAPITTAKEKAAIVKELAGKLNLNRLMSDFLVLMANKDRLIFLPQVREEFSSVRLVAEGGIPGRLEAAEGVEQADIEYLTKAFSRKFGKKVAFQVKTDPALLAGIKVTVNGVTYDGTLRSQLQRLRDRFLVGIASGN